MTRGKRKIVIEDYEKILNKKREKFTSNDIKKVDKRLLERGIISIEEYNRRRKIFKDVYKNFYIG